MATPAYRMQTATGFKFALEQPAAWSWCLSVVLVTHDTVWEFLEGARDFKARSAAKEHTNEVRSGGRDPGVSGPGAGFGQSSTCSKFSRAQFVVCLSLYVSLFIKGWISDSHTFHHLHQF